jgi:BirA family transcriptional regulator, biotin operon repressor / biotin---[acetyl-CoA-carboxylase] ligase
MIDANAPVEVFDEIDSTILEVWLVAKRQTAGRGRRGRAWASLEGNLSATLLFLTEAPAPQIAFLGFATGVSIAECFDAMIGEGRASLKWPNDVLIDAAKVAGIMLDSGALGRSTWVALAFGVNLLEAPKNIDQPTISLRDVLAPDALAPTALEFLTLVRARLALWSARIEREGFEPLRQAWLKRAYGIGRTARIAQGGASLEGRIAGLSPRGELELDTAEGRRLVAAGDVIFANAE